nr:4Fe-4S binding protein [Candidatus Njordarchaeum guaymaensis]
RNPDRPYCSRICCTTALKNALLIKEQLPKAEVSILYRDIRAFGKGQEECYGEARSKGINFFKFSADNPPKVFEDENEHLTLLVNDQILGMPVEIPTDLLVLSEAMTPRHDATDLASKLTISRSPDGFFREAHPKLRPLDTMSDGIYLAGVAQGPKNITESLIQASGAAARAAIPLSKGRVEVEPIIAVVDEELCRGCGRCEEVCPYNAVKLEEIEPFAGAPMSVARVNEVICKGCGACAVTCPTGAITMKHFTDRQIRAMIKAAIGG